MPSKLQTYMQMADEAQRQITGSYRGWTGFLTTAARLYKYPYAEQVMIHAQRPDATACAEYDFWNEKMGRYVRRGSKGIALIDSSGERPRLRYVFDVSDTGGREFPKSRYLWEYREEHADAVSAMLESRYGVDGKGGLPDQLERIASQLAEEYWRDYKRDILAIVDDSFLYGYDEFNVGAAFQSAAAVSIAYSLMSRCGLEADDRFEHEDFLSIFDFNTPEAAAELGTAVSRINGEVLRQIEVTSRITSARNSRKGAIAMTELTYTKNGDYLIPDLTLSETPEDARPLGKYGRLRRSYLQEHRPGLYSRLVLSEKLFPHLREIDETANRRLEQMMPELMKSAGVTEELKARDQMKWVGLMNSLKAQAEEIILSELVYN